MIGNGKYIKIFHKFFLFSISSNPEDILRYFSPMKNKIATLYDNLQNATSQGNLREVIKIEEKLKLLQ
jgi:hypothetical protein